MTRRVLVEVGRETSPAGVNALVLAERIDSPQFDTGSSLAALSRQHLAALEVAVAGAATREVDPLDEVKAMRVRRQQEGRRRA